MFHKKIQQEKAKEYIIRGTIDKSLSELRFSREETLYSAKTEALESLVAAVADRSTHVDYIREISDLHFGLVMNHYRELKKNN